MIKTLNGIKVVDFSLAASGPLCTKILAEYGADVVLVEPVTGLTNRQLTQFNYMFSGKKDLPLNLKTEEGKKIMDQLLSEADVFVSNYRTKALIKLGLGYEELHKKYPKLVYAAITGYGNYGPLKDAPGFDTSAFWGMAGLLNDMREKDAAPMQIPSGFGDAIVGTFLALGVCAALIRRNSCGEGMEVSTSLLQTGAFLNFSQLMYQQNGVEYPKSRLKPNRALQNIYPCKDGYFPLTILDFSKFPKLLKIINREDLIGDPRWTCIPDTENAKAPELRAILDDAFKNFTLDELEEKFKAEDLPFARFTSAIDLLDNEQVNTNNLLVDYTDPQGHQMKAPVSPLVMGDNMYEPVSPAPLLGQNTYEILKAHGYSDTEIEQLVASGVTVTK